MINRFIWQDLSTDDTDSNQSEFENRLQASKPSFQITDFTYLNYWKSLKTLLGDPSADWATNRIIDSQERLSQFQLPQEQAKLPAIFISQLGAFSPLVNQPDRWAGEICLSIHCPENSNNLLAYQIYQRIRNLWFPLQPGLGSQRAQTHRLCPNPNLGIVNIEIKLARQEDIYDRSMKIIFNFSYNEF
jgi:hypothetical protein